MPPPAPSHAFFATALALIAGCTAPERSFGGGGSGPATGTSSSGSTATGSTSTTSTQQGPGGGGDGGDGGGSPSSSSHGGGGATSSAAGRLCGNGKPDPFEECDEDTGLCNDDCLVVCPSGWVKLDGSCFAVAFGVEEGEPVLVDAFQADARCAALGLAATGHRARAATPTTANQFTELAERCPGSGCWLGYYALGPPATSSFVAPSTGQVLPVSAPWGGGEPTRAATDVCLHLSAQGIDPRLDARDCVATTAYHTCQLSPDWGPVYNCGDTKVEPQEECDGGSLCVDCNRVCPDETIEDPRTHACLMRVANLVAAEDAELSCSTTFAGSVLATPDQVEDVRILQFVGAGWIGLAVAALGNPDWFSGERFLYSGSDYPMPDGLGDVDDVGYLAVGIIQLEAAAKTRAALCERFDPDQD